MEATWLVGIEFLRDRLEASSGERQQKYMLMHAKNKIPNLMLATDEMDLAGSPIKLVCIVGY